MAKKPRVFVSEEARRQLKWMKLFTATSDYGETIEVLCEMSDFDVPDGEPSSERFRELLKKEVAP